VLVATLIFFIVLIVHNQKAISPAQGGVH
jgi:hypothetical protein